MLKIDGSFEIHIKFWDYSWQVLFLDMCFLLLSCVFLVSKDPVDFFPPSRVEGEPCAEVVTEMQFRRHIQRWLRCVLRAALESVEGAWTEADEW